MNSDLDYCRVLAAQKDYGGYVTSLTMPRAAREALWPLLALRVVLSGIPETVSDPTLGYIRLAWWRQEIESLGAKAQSDPVLKALAQMAKARNLLPEDFMEFVNAYEVLIEGKAPPDAPFDVLAVKILGRHFARWKKVDAARVRIEAKYRGTQWQGEPPFFAIRLLAASILRQKN